MIIKQKQANAFAAHTGFVITRSGICQLHFQYATETIDIEWAVVRRGGILYAIHRQQTKIQKGK